MSDLRIVIGADIGNTTQQLGSVAKGLNDVSDKAGKAEKSLNKLSTGGANQATSALTNLGRVVQDAPFGFIGIANNINPLLESFQRLKQESGGTGKALKALVSSLAGAGGLGLAVSLGSAALSLFGLAMNKSGTEAKKASEKIDEYGKTVQGIASRIGEQVGEIDVLVKAYERQNLSQEQRIGIIQKLKQISPEYFNQLKEEKTSIDELSEAYKKYVESIDRAIIAEIKRARLKTLLERRIQLSVDLNLEEQDTRFDALFDNIPKEAQKAIDKTNSIFRKDPFKKNQVAPVIEDSAIRDYRDKLSEFNKISQEAFQIEIDLAKNLVVKPFDADKSNVKKVKKEAEKLMEHVFGKRIVLPTSADIKFDLEQVQKEADSKLGQVKMKPIKLNIDEGDAIRSARALAREVEAINTQATENIEQTFNNMLGSIGESIADSIGSGANLFESIFGNLFKVLGAGIKQLGEAMVALGTAKIALEKFKFAPGIGTVIAGIAAIALGALLEKAIPQFAEGVTNFGGGLAVVGERGPELVRLPKGSDVIPNHALGSVTGGAQVFIPDVNIRGTDLVLVFNRATQRIGRNG